MADDINGGCRHRGLRHRRGAPCGRARRRRREGRDPRGRREVDRATAVQTYWDAVIKVPECPYPPVPQAMHPVSNDLNSWYEQAGPDLFASTYLKVVGGTTWHWLGTCLRFVPNDFRLRTLYGQAVDWPICYDDLEPFYGEAEHEIGVAGDAGDDLGAPRSTPYPMPAIPQTYLDKAFAQALADTPTRCAHAAGAALAGSRRPARLLRQRQLHPGLPGPGQVRRDRPPRPGDRRRGGAAPRRRRRSSSRSARTAGCRRSASSAGTAAKAAPRARSSSSPRTRSRRRACCSTPPRRRPRAVSPTAPTRSAAT